MTDANRTSEWHSATIDTLLEELNLSSVSDISLATLQGIVNSSKIIDYIPHMQNIFKFCESHELDESTMSKFMILTRVLGEYHRSKRDGDIAIDIWNFNIKHTKYSLDKKFEIIDLISISEAYCNIGNYSKALSYAERLLHRLKEIGLDNDNNAEYATTFKILGKINMYLGNYDLAKSYTQKALIASEQNVSSVSEIVSLKNILAFITMYLGQYAEALSILQQCDNMLNDQDMSEHFERLFVTNNMGFCQLFLGNLQEANNSFQKSFAIAQKYESEGLASPVMAFIPMTNLGAVSLLQERLDEAAQKFKYILEHTEKHYNTLPVHIYNMINLGYYNYYIGDYEQSYKLAKKSETWFKEEVSNISIFHNLLLTLLLHKIHEEKREYVMSIQYLRKSLEIAKHIFKDNIHDATQFFYIRYLVWNPTIISYDKESLEYINNAMTLSKELFGDEHTEVHRYQYFKAVYYMQKGDKKLAGNILSLIPLVDKSSMNQKNIQLIKEAFTLAK